MNKSLSVVLGVGLALVFASALYAGTLENQGKAWLDAQKDPAGVNVSGAWKSDIADVKLVQAAGSRDVTGSGVSNEGCEYDLKGVVSGKTLYLLFVNRTSTVDYCIVASSDSSNILSGYYQNKISRLAFGNGLCDPRKYSLKWRKK